MSNVPLFEEGTVVAGAWKIDRKLGAGACGEVATLATTLLLCASRRASLSLHSHSDSPPVSLLGFQRLSVWQDLQDSPVRLRHEGAILSLTLSCHFISFSPPPSLPTLLFSG